MIILHDIPLGSDCILWANDTDWAAQDPLNDNGHGAQSRLASDWRAPRTRRGRAPKICLGHMFARRADRRDARAARSRGSSSRLVLQRPLFAHRSPVLWHSLFPFTNLQPWLVLGGAYSGKQAPQRGSLWKRRPPLKFSYWMKALFHSSVETTRYDQGCKWIIIFLHREINRAQGDIFKTSLLVSATVRNLNNFNLQ